MKPLKYTLLALLALGLSVELFAETKRDYPQISLVGPSSGKSTVSRDEFVLLVVEGPFISHEKAALPSKGEVEYVNRLLSDKKASYLGVYVREGAKYGDLLRALDLLRLTNAKSIAVSMGELAAGREP